MDLRGRIIQALPQITSQPAKNCFVSGLQLLQSHGAGKLIWVGQVGEHVGRNEAYVGHFYFVASGAKPDDWAFNEEEVGFGQYPRLSNAEVESLKALCITMQHPLAWSASPSVTHEEIVKREFRIVSETCT